MGVCETQITLCHLGETLNSRGRFSPGNRILGHGSAKILSPEPLAAPPVIPNTPSAALWHTVSAVLHSGTAWFDALLSAYSP